MAATALVQFVNAKPLDTLREVLEQQTCSDVILMCEDGNLRAHRPVLASASGFLKQLLMDVPDEDVTILLPEVRCGIMWKLLEFIYTGNTRTAWSEVPDVTALSDLLMLGVDLGSLNELVAREKEEFSAPTVTAYPGSDDGSIPSEIVVIANHADAPVLLSEIAQQHDLDMTNLSIWMDSQGSKVYVTDNQEVEVAVEGPKRDVPLQVAEVLALEVPAGNEVASVDGGDSSKQLRKGKLIASRRHQCITCNKTFPSRFALRGHLRVHTGEKPFSCNYCERKFTFKSNWKQHELVHVTGQKAKPGPKLIPCEICNKKFRCWSAVVTHKRTHTGDRPFMCITCGKGFAVKSNCKKHEQLHLTGKLDKPRDGKYTCTYCNKMFKTQTYLRVHMKMHNSVRPYVCRLCGKSFNFSSNLATHEKMHHGKIPSVTRSYTLKKRRGEGEEGDVSVVAEPKKKTRSFKCEACGKKFYSKSNLLGHSRVHAGSKDYQCKFCGKTFTYNSNCKKHEQLHKKWDENPNHMEGKLKVDNRVSCDVCMKSFSPSHLRVHKRLHTGEKPYQCRYCVRAFTFSSNCSKHEKLHVQGKQVGRGMDEQASDEEEEVDKKPQFKVEEVHIIETTGDLQIDLETTEAI